MSQKRRQLFPNIVVKSVVEERLGRFTMTINEMEKVVYVRHTGRGPSLMERANIEKFLRHKRPDIVNPKFATGWGIQFALDLPM